MPNNAKRIVACIGFLVAALLAALVPSAFAQEFPRRPVTLIVPFPPGGVADQTGRVLADALARALKQSVVVLNRPGAAGGLGTAAAATAAPDGYTLLVTTSAISARPASDSVLGKPPMFTIDQFAPLARISADPLLLVVRGDGWKDFKALVADAKARPGVITYASSGTYGPAHIPAEMLSHAADIQLRHIPYSGGGPSITALLSGVVDITFGGPAVLAPYIQAGSMKALASTGGERIALFPELPTAVDLGYASAEYYLWAGVFTSSAVPKDIQAKLVAAIETAIRDPLFIKQMDTLGIPIKFLDAARFSEFLKHDIERTEAAIRRIGRIGDQPAQ